MESTLAGLTNRGPSSVDYEKVVQLMTTSGTNSEYGECAPNEGKEIEVSKRKEKICPLLVCLIFL